MICPSFTRLEAGIMKGSGNTFYSKENRQWPMKGTLKEMRNETKQLQHDLVSTRFSDLKWLWTEPSVTCNWGDFMRRGLIMCFKYHWVVKTNSWMCQLIWLIQSDSVLSSTPSLPFPFNPSTLDQCNYTNKDNKKALNEHWTVYLKHIKAFEYCFRVQQVDKCENASEQSICTKNFGRHS